MRSARIGRRGLWGLAVLAAVLQPAHVNADDANPSEDPLVKRLIAVAQGFEIVDRQSNRKIAIAEQPLLNWVNPSRESVQRGLVYVWESDGRPVAIGSAFSYVWGGQRRIKMQLHSLWQSPLEASYEGQTVWTPAARGMEWKSFSGAPAPASNERRRLTQMRLLARQFQVTTTSREGEMSALRLLPQPLHRYGSPKHGIADGAIFSFVVATDPDALLVIEDVELEGTRQYRYAFARFHYNSIEAKDRSGTVVWEAAADFSQINHHMGDASHFQKLYVTFHVDAWPEEPSVKIDDQ